MAKSLNLHSKNTEDPSPKSRVLCIDDDDLLLGLIEKELDEIKEFQFFGEENAKIGLERAKEIKPDVIVFDHVSKGLSGNKFLSEVKDSSALKDTKVLILSKKIDSKRIQRYDELGVDDFIEKPFKMSELVFRLKKLT